MCRYPIRVNAALAGCLRNFSSGGGGDGEDAPPVPLPKNTIFRSSRTPTGGGKDSWVFLRDFVIEISEKAIALLAAIEGAIGVCVVREEFFSLNED